MLHKAPAAFGLVTFLMHEGVERTKIRKHLLTFSFAAPTLALTTYILLAMNMAGDGGLQGKVKVEYNLTFARSIGCIILQIAQKTLILYITFI